MIITKLTALMRKTLPLFCVSSSEPFGNLKQRNNEIKTYLFSLGVQLIYSGATDIEVNNAFLF